MNKDNKSIQVSQHIYDKWQQLEFDNAFDDDTKLEALIDAYKSKQNINANMQRLGGSFESVKEFMLNNSATHFVLINAINAFDECDPVDTLKDTEILHALFEQKIKEICNTNI